MPHALLERPVARTHPARREGDTPLPPHRRICERTAHRIAQLLRTPESLPAFAPLDNAALACPDAFLVHAPGGDSRFEIVGEWVEQARRFGQRLLVLARGSNAVSLVRGFHERGHAAVLCANLDGLPADVLALTERRRAERERAEECLQLETQVNRAAEELERLERTQRRYREFEQHRDALQRELAELEHPAAPHAGGLGGFVKKLFGSAKPAEPAPRIAELRDQLRQLATPPTVENSAIEQAAAAHRAADAAFAWAIAKPLAMAPDTAAAAQVVVAEYDALSASPLLADDAPRFDRLIVVDGEDLDETEFFTAAARAEAWTLLGNPEADGYFTYLWMHLHKPGPWVQEANRRVYQLAAATSDRSEPLADRTEIELRFAAGELVGIAFPQSMPLAEAKAFLARELGDLCERDDPTGCISARTAVWER